MMKAVIIEDEKLNADHLQSLIDRIDDIEVIARLTSVARAYSWFIDNENPDLVFMDIELGDGSAFDLLEVAQIQAPLIFTTAYNEYAIKAFKYNSIDYLLKPIEFGELKVAIDKYRKSSESQATIETIKRALRHDIPQQYKQRFLVKSGDQLLSKEVSEIAYFFSEDSYTQIMDKAGKSWFIDYSLEDLNEILDPSLFFRLNRKVFTSIGSIDHIASYFNGRLVVRLSPEFSEQLVISREKVKPFKQWLDR